MYVIWLNITTGEKQTYNNKTEKKTEEHNNKRESHKVYGATN